MRYPNDLLGLVSTQDNKHGIGPGRVGTKLNPQMSFRVTNFLFHFEPMILR
jgi:hypothetical protein